MNQSEFLAAIVGAAVSGLVALGIQSLVFWQARSERRNSARKLQDALAFSVFEKTRRMHSDLDIFADHVVKAKKRQLLKCAMNLGKCLSLLHLRQLMLNSLVMKWGCC